MTETGHDAAAHEPWARVSLRAVGFGDPAQFARAIAALGSATGRVRRGTASDGSEIWIDACPLRPTATPEQQLLWASREAQALFGAAPQAGVRRELWLALSVDAQLGVVVEPEIVAALGERQIHMVLDLYGSGE